MTLSDEQELEMLREFFDCWLNLHYMTNNNRQAQELAAQRMVEAAQTIKNHRSTQEHPLNG